MLHGQRYLKPCDDGFIRSVENVQNFSFADATAFYSDVEHKDFLDEGDAVALLACNDRFFLLTKILGRLDALDPWVYERCRMIEANPDGYLDLWARYHYKTTLITYAGAIQEMCRNPEVTIALFSITKPIVRKFFRSIMETLETNEILKNTFPDVFWQQPRKEAPQWSLEDGIINRREGTRQEPTMGAYGLIDAMPTGGHFDLLIYNDIITEKLVTNQEMVAKSTERFELSGNLGVGEGTRKWMEGTRYSFADTYGFLIEKGIVRPRIFAATHNGQLDDYYYVDERTGKTTADKTGEHVVKRLNPVFVSLEHWQKIKVEQRSVVAAQMLQNPLAGKQNTFQPMTLRRYAMRPRTLNVYIMGDYASGEKKNQKTDNSCILAIGTDHNGNKFLLDGARYRMTLTERWQELSRIFRRWTNAPGVQTVSVGYERYGAQSDIQYFEEQMRKPGQPQFNIIELNWPREGLGSKAARIQRLEPDFVGNHFYLPDKIWRPHAAWWTDEFGRERPGLKPDEKFGKQYFGPRICRWNVDQATDKLEYRPIPLDPDRAYQPMLTEDEVEARRSGEGYLVIEALRRSALTGPQSREMYDLTYAFIEEFIFDPFSLHDDVIDTASRIYDMDPQKAVVLDKTALEHETYTD